MKRLAVIFASTFALISLPSLASEVQSVEPMDHRGSGYQTAAEYAYRIADIGESYQGVYNSDLAYAGREMHMAATDLYYALQGGSGFGEGMGPMDHRGGGSFDAMVDRLGHAVRNFSRVAPYYDANQAQNLYRGIVSSLNS